MTTYHLDFGKVGDTYPVPATTITADDSDENAFPRAVAEHAIPHLKPALAEKGRPELADCFFRTDRELTEGSFMWVDLAEGVSALFCPARLTPTP